ncbi:hypothetical protein [Flavobacterium solisilvae]|uniref:Signal peptidase n=1 Tax=Flavobacterium solisilvae TaxID=1852019 RepID=A0ABX1QXR8_9FLAO|nr:hypothetical protein [Flavobacterium solisilvae]NMH25629.1 hypothetical protein [Flavobacterium solisilvae]
MKNIFRIYLLLFFLLSDFIVFAQDDETDINPCVECEDDTQPAPINSKLIWLAIAGILFVLYKRNQLKKLSDNN